MNFKEYPDIFSNLGRVLYVGIDHDYEGLEELAKRHGCVVGIDKYICDTSHHAEEREKILKEYPNLQIKQMDARKLKFPDRYFDGILFKQSLGFIGGEGKIKNEKDIQRALDEAYRVLYQEGLVWIIYAPTDIINLTLDRMNLLLKSSGFETIEDAENYRICEKIKESAADGI